MASREEIRKTDFLKVTTSTGIITNVIAPNGLQIGLDDPEFQSNLIVKGKLVSPILSGSLTALSDGTPYLQAGSNVTITNNSNGSITIAATSTVGTSNLTQADGITAFTFDGTSAQTVGISLASSRGLSFNGSGELQIDMTAAGTTAATLGDNVMVGSGGSATPTLVSIADILTLVSTTPTALSNPLLAGYGLGFKDSTNYNNSSTKSNTLGVLVQSAGGLMSGSSGIAIDPSTLGLITVATDDKVLVGDTSSGDAISYVTAQSIANLATVGVLTNDLTVGDGLQLDSGTTFDGQNARTISIKLDGSTAQSSAAGLSVLSVPNALSEGSGIATFSYDGSSAPVVAIDLGTTPGLNFSSGDLVLDIESLSAGAIPTLLNELALSYGGLSTHKVDLGSIKTLFGVGTLTNPLTVGTGLQLDSGTTFDGSSAKTISANDKIVATLTGSQFSGNVGITGSLGVVGGLSGSLTQLVDGSSYLVAGSNVTIASASNGQVTISSTGGGGGGTITVSSGSTTVSSVDTIDVSKLGVLQSLGSGDVAITGSIGLAEDGSYTDGLFTDFKTTTPVGTAVDRFNEVLKGLAPSAAPSLDDMNCSDSGTNAVLSFGSSQSIAGYTNAQPSTLTPTDNLSDVDINETYSSTTTSNDVRVACFDGATVVDGTLNADVAADTPNYAADSFGDGEQGTLKLFVNDNSTPVYTVNLSLFGSGLTTNANGSGFNLSAETPGHFSDGSNFETFQHRQGTYTIATADQRDGWNYARVVHTIGTTDRTCNYVEWVNDPDANALTSAGSAFDSLSMTGTKNLSGVKYNTGGSAEYRVRVSNAYRNIYSTQNITFSSTNCSVSSQAFPSINYGAGEDETKVLHITGSSTITGDPILNDSISVSVNVPSPLKSDLSSAGSQSIGGILLYDLSNTSNSTLESFKAENYRLVSGSYNAQSDVSDVANAWSSTTSLLAVDGLMFYNSRLYAPVQGGVSGDFRNTADGGSITNGPSSNVNYSTITTGLRTFYRYFENTSGGSKTDFTVTINGSGTIVSQGTSLSTGNISVLFKLPTTLTTFSTGWMDLAVAFATGQTGNGAGCLNGSLDS